MDPFIERHRDGILSIAKEMGITNLRVFGSMARGDAALDSDIDLLGDFPEDADILDLCRFRLLVRELTGRKVDVATDEMILPPLRDAVFNEALPL